MKSLNESQIQADIVKALRLMGVFCFSVPNEAAGVNVVRQGQLISTGLYSGVSDLIVWLPDGVDLYMEVKTPTGKQSERQKKFEARCIATGRQYCIVRSVDDAVKKVKKSIDKHDNVV